MDVESVSSEDSFSMWEVPADPQQENDFFLEQLQFSYVVWNHGKHSEQFYSEALTNRRRSWWLVKSRYRRKTCTKLQQSKVLRRACLWNHKAPVNDAMWEAAAQNVRNIGVRSCFCMEIDKGCPQPPVLDDSIFGQYIGTIVQNKDGDEEPALKTDVGQRRCRVISKCPWWNLSCDDDVWLREQGTMNRVQNRLMYEQLEHIHNQSRTNEFGCYFEDSKTLEVRPA